MGEEEKSYSHERKPKFLEVNEDRRKTTGWALVGLDGPAQFGPLLFFLSLFFYVFFSILYASKGIQNTIKICHKNLIKIPVQR
jgi:predicted Zn-dependent peptidase